jgi:sugar phosphate isomerase/epimerase
MSLSQLKHPLSAPTKSGIDNLRRLGLNTESSMADDIEALADFADVMVSAHAPSTIDEMKLNYATKDEDFRHRSIEALLRFIDRSRNYPNVKQVNIHPPPKRWLDETQTEGRDGDWGLMIDAMRQVAGYAAAAGIEIVVENLNFYYAGIPEETTPEQIDWTERNMAFGAEPEEWVQICEDVANTNLSLCLDSSHIVTYAHSVAEDKRVDAVMKFVSRPELIKHVHWNDNHMYDARGRNDSHAVLGKGSLPIDIHRAIKDLDATLHLEHFYTIEELEEELEFIDRL